MHGKRTQAGNDLVAPRARRAGHGQQDVGHVLALHQFGDAMRRKHHHAIDAAAHLGRIVVDESDQGELVGVGDGAGGLHARLAGAIDQQAAFGG